ncbi:MAG: leucine-rich repeat domain-containing protein [Muribaculaceae bacterium]|nr:leucine-rich repeat domain-containing protein [Muribaculaceae bacterium]
MKQIIQKLGLVLAMLIAAIPSRAYDFMVDGIAYDILSLSDLTCKVAQADEMYEGEIVIPSSVTLNGRALKIIAISASCFKDCVGLTSIILPESVIELQYACFRNCSGLTSIDIPESVTKLGEYCFYKCKSLTSIVISESITELPEACFAGCTDLTLIDIPESVTSIGDYCFKDCTSLTTIDIPESVTSIGDYCFNNCTSLTTIDIPESVTELPKFCFEDCSGLTSVNIPESVTKLGLRCFYRCTGLTSIEIPESVIELGEYCFMSAENLKTIYPDLIKCNRIGGGCFESCHNLEEIGIDASYLGPDVVAGCSNLKKAYINAEQLIFPFFRCNQLSLVNIGSDVKKVAISDKEGFPYYSRLWDVSPKELKICDGNTRLSIGYRHGVNIDLPSISYCNACKEIWAENVETLYLGRSLDGFNLNCPNLKSLTLGTYIDAINLGSTREEVSISEFSSLTYLKSLNPEPPYIGTPTAGQYATLEVEVPNKYLEAYRSNPVWGQFWNLKGVSTDIVEATTDIDSNLPCEVYTVQGMKISDSTDGLAPGMYIVRQGASVKKIAVK